MSPAPKVSVIIPIYNMGDYLEECLSSCLQQSLTEIELVCINDGSTDNSADILNHFAQKDNRVQALHKENQGVAAARNDGIRAASGKYLYFLDPDDHLPAQNTLELLYTKAIAHNTLICGGSMAYFKQDNPRLSQKFAQEFDGYLFAREGEMLYADYQFDFGFTRFIYSRAMVVENGLSFPPCSFFEDPPFMVQAMLCAKSFYALPQITYAYRIGHHSIHWSPQKTSHLFAGLQQVWNLATKHHLPRLRQYVWYRLRSFYADTRHLLTPEQEAFARSIDAQARPKPQGLRHLIFSKNKYLLDKNQRQFTLLGVTFTTTRNSKAK